MEALEHEPLPISARPLASLVPTRGLNFFSENGHEAGNNYYSNNVVEEEQEDYYYDDEENSHFSKSRSINNILRRPSVVNRFSGFLSGVRERIRGRIMTWQLWEWH